MKTTENKKTIALINRLSEVIEARKALDNEEKNIKADLKGLMAEMGVNALGAGDYVMVISDRVRTELDREELQKFLGAALYGQYVKKIPYQIFEVKKS